MSINFSTEGCPGRALTPGKRVSFKATVKTIDGSQRTIEGNIGPKASLGDPQEDCKFRRQLKKAQIQSGNPGPITQHDQCLGCDSPCNSTSTPIS